MNHYDVSGKRIVVTGGGGRLGTRMVASFASRGATIAAIVVSDEEAARVPVGEGGRVEVIRAAVTSEDSVAAAFREIGSLFGGIDALVHTVGMWRAEPLLRTTHESWNTLLTVNLGSAFLCFREAAALMGQKGGTLIAMASGQGADRGVAEQAAYSAAKAGIVRLVESVAAEHSERGIKAHAVAPSAILFDDSEGVRGVRADEIIRICGSLIDGGGGLNGATLRAYGTAYT